MPRFVVLTADGGEMTVTRPVATVVWGAWQVTIPEGREQQERDSRVSDGYVCIPQKPLGRFDLACVRADATVDASAGILQGVSTVEQSIDNAQKKTSGDIFFERDITGLGFGRFTPGADFTTGDIVDVWIWGKLMELPVTALDMVSTVANQLDWRAHVGGQLIADTDAVQEANRKIQAGIDAERQKRMGETKSLTTATSNAAKAASSAQKTADEAKETADEAQDKAIESLEKFREIQEEWNRAKDAIDASQTAVTRALERAAARFLFCDREKTVKNNDVEISNPRFSRTVAVRAHGSWVGTVVIFVNTINGSTLQRQYDFTEETRNFNITMPVGAVVANTVVMYQIQDKNLAHESDTNDKAGGA